MRRGLLGKAARTAALCALVLPVLLGGEALGGAFLARGDQLAADGLYEQALAQYQAAGQFEPASPAPYLKRGALDLRWGDPARAREDYDKARLLSHLNPTAWLGAGRAAATLGDKGAAADLLSEAARLGAEPRAAYEAGLLRIELGDLEAAKDSFAQAAAAADARGDVDLALTARVPLSLLIAVADPAAATAELSRADRTAADADRVRALLGDYTQARQAQSEAQRDAILGRGALREGLVPLAETLLRRAVALVPAYPDARAYLSLALIASGQPAAGEMEAAAALAVDPSHPLARYAHAVALRAQGEAQEAILALRPLVAEVPAEPSFVLELAAACADYGDYKTAGEYSAQAAALAQGNPSTLLAVARFHLDRAFRPEAALPWLAQVVDKTPRDATAWEYYGWALQLAGRHAEGAGALQRSLEIDPRAASAHYRLGVVYEKEGLAAEARAEYAWTADLDPGGDYGRRARDSLAALASPSG